MNQKFCPILPSVILVLWLAFKAAAQDNLERPWNLQVDFGFVSTAGNASTTTRDANAAVSYSLGRWTLSQLLAIVYGHTSGQTTTENYQASLRSDLPFSKRFGW